ncbi:MAG TPA: ATP-binding protein [Gemmatimonadaceae bacterium]|nr:ATP-binding protein [Gemmatimonadaceae bacterium]
MRARADAGGEPLGLAVGLLFFAPIVLLGSEAGSWLRYPEIGSAVLYPPYALLTAVLVLSPRRTWIWYLLVTSVAHFLASWPQWSASWVLVADAANLTRALVAALLLRRVFRGPPRLDGMDAIVRFAASTVLVAPAAAATIGAMNVVFHGSVTTYWRTWAEWYMSNALTGLTLLPALVLGVPAALRWRYRRVNRVRVAEAVLLAASFVVSGIIALLVPIGGRWHLALMLYMPVPALIWTALRFGTGAASFALSAVAFAAIWGADQGTGLFLGGSPDENVLVLQLFVLITTLPVLCIAGVNGARHGMVQLHRALLASLHDHVAIIDARGVVLEVNESWRRFAESHRPTLFHRATVGDDFVGACRASAEHGDATASKVLKGVTRVLNREVGRFEMEYDDDHSRVHGRYALSVEALEHYAGGAVVTRADVTARRQAQMEIEEQRRELSHLARVGALGQLSGAFAHELNQPLASISNNAEAGRLLLRRHPTDLSEIDEILRDILAADQRAAHVIRRLQALLKRGETRLQPIDAAELVNEVLELARAELITRRVNASAVIAPDLPLVLADRIQIQQVLLNLILNACEAMRFIPVADRRISLSLATDAGGNLRFSVQDSGAGIAPTLIDHLFEPFVTTKAEGLGLGLSISRTIVAAHGGRLWAENNADHGATVHCMVPPAPARTSGEIPVADPGGLFTTDAPPVRVSVP